MSKKYKYYIDVPIWVQMVDCFYVIAESEEEAMRKFEDCKDVIPLDTESVDEERGKPQITGKEEILVSGSTDQYTRTLEGAMEESSENCTKN